MNAVAEELRKINRANIEATLALEEQKAVRCLNTITGLIYR